jgi:PAS domain S-box-containing protein
VYFGGAGKEPLPDHLLGKEPFRLALEAAPTGMILVDDRGRIALVNTEVERLFGYSRDEVIGEPVEILLPERFRGHVGFRGLVSDAPPGRAMASGRDVFGRRKDGSEVPIEIGLNPLDTPDGRFVLSSVADISERRQGERERDQLLAQLEALNTDLERRVETRTRELEAALRDREVLLQEVHHRVKNNLQVIASLINMQVRALGGGAGRDALVECGTRVEAMALIHEKLYQSQHYSQVAFSEYARTLAASVFHATGLSPHGIALDLAMEDVSLSVDRAIPCGLVLNELITNALRHAFPAGRTGTIRVQLAAVGDGAIRLAVSDDGVGLPPGFEIETSRSLGLQLVRMLAGQLGAALQIDSTAGTRVALILPAEEA